ncbi:MAG: hypothetical protein HYR70_05420 [Chloroflexi bacterium]|nr:hypothetical protein [Chloroflexota bacterium]MBI1854290.1 hypothetical protein [Chloroflexota bacterium]MBI3338623.1 hypothetical protein [Chloroflexota bacterium]
MRPKYIFLVAFLFVTACSPFLAPTPTDSGVDGNVTIGPMCPVVQVNNPCPDKPYQATLTILTTTTRRKVIQFKTDANGYFRAALAPGEYILRPESPNVMPRAAEIPFTVTDRQFTRVDVVYDSGIR